MPLHPNSLKNLRPGEAFRQMSKEQIKAHADHAQRARTQAMNTRLERQAVALDPIEALHLGMRVGYNRAYQRWRHYATRIIAQAYRRGA